MQVELLEEQWAITKGFHEEYLAKKREFESEREQLTRQFGVDAHESDVKWSLFNKELMRHANDGNFGLYRNTRLQMAEFLRKEGKFEASLSTYIEIFYLDLNGPQNSAGLSRPYFLSSESFIAPGIIAKIESLVDRLKWSEKDVWHELERVGRIIHKSLKLPLSPEAAWIKIRQQLFP
jgi:hypothetical protein